MEKIKIDPEWDNLAKEAAEARNAGVTYGVFEGRRYAKVQEEILEKERRYAEYKVRKERERAGTVCIAGAEDGKDDPSGHSDDRDTSSTAAARRKCLGCGKVLTGNQKKYCSARCEYLVNQEVRKEARKEKYWEDHPREGRKCTVCGALLETQQKFYCSESCARAARNGRRRKTER